MKGTAESAGRSPGRPAESRSLSSAIVTPDGMASKTVEAIVVFMHSTQDRTRHIETDAPTQQIVRGGAAPSGRRADTQPAVVRQRDALQCVREDNRNFVVQLEIHTASRIGKCEVQDRVRNARGDAFVKSDTLLVMTDVTDVLAKLLPATGLCPGQPCESNRLLVNQDHERRADRNPDDSGCQRVDQARVPLNAIKTIRGLRPDGAASDPVRAMCVPPPHSLTYAY